MTLAEERERLAAMLLKEYYKAYENTGTQLEGMLGAFAAISAAGFSIVGPEVTEEMVCDGSWFSSDPARGFKAMLAAGDLARKPE